MPVHWVQQRTSSHTAPSRGRDRPEARDPRLAKTRAADSRWPRALGSTIRLDDEYMCDLVWLNFFDARLIAVIPYSLTSSLAHLPQILAVFSSFRLVVQIAYKNSNVSPPKKRTHAEDHASSSNEDFTQLPAF